MTEQARPGGPRPGAGRKRLAAEKQRRHRVMINLTEAERALLEAERGEESLGSYIRRTALRIAKRTSRRRRKAVAEDEEIS